MNIEDKIENATDRAAAGDRITQGAERLKARESAAMESTREAVERGSRHAERVMHQATDATADAALRAGAKAAELGERGREQLERGREHAEESLENLFAYVRENPGKSVALALAGGWLLGNLFRRH